MFWMHFVPPEGRCVWPSDLLAFLSCSKSETVIPATRRVIFVAEKFQSNVYQTGKTMDIVPDHPIMDRDFCEGRR